jgi:hypothetical protein
MDTATLQALWRQCAPPTSPWHNDAGESALLHLRVAHYLRHLTVQLHRVFRDVAQVRWETYDRAHAAGHAGLCGVLITPADGHPLTLEWTWDPRETYGLFCCPQLDLVSQPITVHMRDTDFDRSLLALLPSMFTHMHGLEPLHVPAPKVERVATPQPTTC